MVHVLVGIAAGITSQSEAARKSGWPIGGRGAAQRSFRRHSGANSASPANDFVIDLAAGDDRDGGRSHVSTVSPIQL